MTTFVYCERCDRLLDTTGEDTEQVQEAQEVCVGCLTEEEWDAEQEGQ